MQILYIEGLWNMGYKAGHAGLGDVQEPEAGWEKRQILTIRRQGSEADKECIYAEKCRKQRQA